MFFDVFIIIYFFAINFTDETASSGTLRLNNFPYSQSTLKLINLILISISVWQISVL
jgi:hypothetical protein